MKSDHKRPPAQIPRAYRVVVWYPNIKPEDRDSRTLSDGAQFAKQADAVAFARRVRLSGGAVKCTQTIEDPTIWYASLAEFDRFGRRSLAEIEQWKARFHLAVPNDDELRQWALANGWDASRVSLYDEEGIEGWQWTDRDGSEYYETGDWSEPPAIGDEWSTLRLALIVDYVTTMERQSC